MVGKPSRTAWLGEPSCSHGRTQQEDQAGGLPLRPELHGPSRSALFSRMPRCYSGQFHTHSSLGCLKSPLGVKEDLTRGTQSTFSYSFSPKRLQFSPDQALRLSFAPRDTSTDRLQGTRLTHRRGQAVQKRSLCAPPPPAAMLQPPPTGTAAAARSAPCPGCDSLDDRRHSSCHPPGSHASSPSTWPIPLPCLFSFCLAGPGHRCTPRVPGSLTPSRLALLPADLLYASKVQPHYHTGSCPSSQPLYQVLARSYD